MPLPAHLAQQVVVVVPTSNAAADWRELAAGILSQGLPPRQVVIIDSSSTDGTPELARHAGFHVISIHRQDFNHGGTRQAALAAAPWATIAVYLTQDAILATDDAIEHLVAPFQHTDVGATYGRQLPRLGAGPFEAHARLFNYPAQSLVRTWDSRTSLGLKAAFLSNSFAAYRVSALLEVGGFPTDVIMAEDTLVAALLLKRGWKTVYAADATVRHSHGYTALQEFRRYFDTGVYHARQGWLLQDFGSAGGEGLRFVRSELAYLKPRHQHLVPLALLRTGAKVLGYRLGRKERFISSRLKRMLSMHRHFW